MRAYSLLFAALLLPAVLPAQTATPAEKTAEQVFKNIQVFNGKPASELRPTMDFMAGSLGVECSFCHAQPFDSDAKPEKKTARQMIQMVFDLNKNNFGGRNQINCYTCHQGHNEPRSNLSVADPAAPPPPPAPAVDRSALPTAQALLDKYVQALGGQAALDAAQSMTIAATRIDGQGSTPETVVRGAGGKLALTDTRGAGSSKSGSDGDQFWSWSSGSNGGPGGPAPAGAREVSASLQVQLAIEAQLFPAAGLKAQGARVGPPQPVGARSAYVLSVRSPNGASRYYFDTESGLLLRVATSTPTILGALPLQVDFSDYRAVHGVQVPFDAHWSDLDRGWEVKASDVQINAPVDAAAFQSPVKN